ncbi:MAG: ketoacyl-ACP synthase III [Clostridiales bacterium]|jgi:3-oxoacyl-[acyl-carrier-protein] synthase-3|nr:ketoacyl-ACP synthase III [Clostridiales bacterium]
MGLKIVSTGIAVPEKTVTNNDIAQFLDTSDDWIVSKTGIKQRAVATRESLTDLAFKAAVSALKGADLAASDMDFIICSTILGDYTSPSLACAVSERLKTICPAFDINAACTGFIYALSMAQAYIDSGAAANILIISADMLSSLVDWTDRAVCVLFGDGAGACVVTRGNSLKYMKLAAYGDTSVIRQRNGTGNNPFSAHASKGEFMTMEGQEVFRFAVNAIEREVNSAFSALNITSSDINYFMLHQANKRIIDSARKRLSLPEEKFPVNIDKYGNTSSASIPILLNEMLEGGKIKKGDNLLLTAFGAGLTTGTCVLNWE